MFCFHSFRDSVSITKRHITDEQMAQHLKDLHISSNYTPHILVDRESPGLTSSSVDVNLLTSPAVEKSYETNQNNSRGCSVKYNIIKDLQRKLSKAQRITLCDEIRQIQSEAQLPESLIYRHERPCNALVLWQPPRKSCTQTNVDNQQQMHEVQENTLTSNMQTSLEKKAMLFLDEDNQYGIMDMDC